MSTLAMMQFLDSRRPNRGARGDEDGRGSRERFDYVRASFWAALAMAAGGAGVTIAAGPGSVGPVGAILLMGLATIGVVFMLWLMGLGRVVGLMPPRGATEAASLGAARGDMHFLDALEEPALVAEQGMTPIVANAAYLAAAEAAGALGESARPPAIDRLFGADPLLSAPMYRLANAARRGLPRREELPPAAFGPDRATTRLEVSVGPLPGGRTLWRLRPLETGSGAEGGEPRRLFIDDAPLGFLAVRPDGTVAYMNHKLRALLGFGEDVQGVRLKDILKDDPAKLLRRDRRGFAQARIDLTLRSRDGVETPAAALIGWPALEPDESCRVFLFFSETAAFAEINPNASPASDPGALALAGALSGLGFFENAPFGAALLDGGDAGKAAILDANPALMEMSQGRAAPGAAFADLFDASDGPAALLKRLREASHKPIELSLATTPPCAAHVHFAQTGDGSGLAYVINVTEQRELEQRLAQSEKMREIGMLAGGVAHDFNNLLTVVMQITDYLLRRHPIGDPAYFDLNQINTYALRAKELSEMLRAYARQQNFKREIVEVSGFVAQTQEMIRRLLGEAIQFEVRHGRDLPLIKADRTQLERVLLNLATNARDAMTPKGSDIARDGRLTIRTYASDAAEARTRGDLAVEEGRYVLIEVADSGMGIKPEDQIHIFQPYHSTKEPGKGTGLGLATTFGIVKQSGGYIFFDSKVGKGTTFRIYLPAYEPSSVEAAEIAQRESESVVRPTVDVAGRGRILFVEDETGVRKSIARNLKECGYEVEEAENGEDALEMLRAKPGAYDIIISDVSMPLMTGPEMLQAAGPDLLGRAKVLFLSGYAPESFGKLLEEYPVSYLSKPVGATTLAQKINQLLAA